MSSQRDPRDDEQDPATDRVESPYGKSVAKVDQRPTALIEIERERAIAEVQAAITIAKKFPRNPADCMELILTECTRKDLAAVATYDYVRGGTSIVGPSIRLVEVVARNWGNIECGVKELTRHEGYSDCLAYAWDMEKNFRDSKTFQVKHWRDTKKGGYALEDERDIYELVANLGARRKRACIEAVIPGDIIESAVRQCELTLRSKAEVTEEKIKHMLELYAALGVTQSMVEVRIQRRVSLQSLTPGMLIQLGKIYNSLSEGMSIVADWFKVDEKEGETETTTKTGRKKAQPKKKDASPEGSKATGQPETSGAAHRPKSQGETASTPPAGAPNGDTPIDHADEVFILKKMDVAAISTVDLVKAFKIERIQQLKKSQLEAVLRWIANPMEDPK